MIDLLILLIFFIGVYSGYKNGLILELLQMIGYVIAIILALDYYKALSEFIYLLIPYPTPFAPDSNPYLFYDEQFMFSMDMTYYDLIAFLAIVFVGYAIVKFIAKFISYTIERLRLPEPFSGIGGGILGLIANYFGVFFILVLLTTIPYGFVQNNLYDSPIASNMITSTPVVSDEIYQVFVADVYEEAVQNRPTMDIQPPAPDESIEVPVEENQE